MTKQKRAGRPRKTEAGGSTISFYLSREAQEYIRTHGGTGWIKNMIAEDQAEKLNVGSMLWQVLPSQVQVNSKVLRSQLETYISKNMFLSFNGANLHSIIDYLKEYTGWTLPLVIDQWAKDTADSWQDAEASGREIRPTNWNIYLNRFESEKRAECVEFYREHVKASARAEEVDLHYSAMMLTAYSVVEMNISPILLYLALDSLNEEVDIPVRTVTSILMFAPEIDKEVDEAVKEFRGYIFEDLEELRN